MIRIPPIGQVVVTPYNNIVFPKAVQSSGVSTDDVLALSPFALWDGTVAGENYQDESRTTLVNATNDPCASLTDLTGNGEHLAIAAGLTAERPLYDGSGLSFDGVNDYLVKAFGSTLSQDFTFVVGYQLVTAPSATKIHYGGGGILKPLGQDATGNFEIQLSITKDVGSLDTNFNVFSIVYDGTSTSAWKNQTQTLTNENAGSQSLTGLSLGGRYGVGDFNTNMVFMRAGLFSGTLSADDRNLVESWCDTQEVL